MRHRSMCVLVAIWLGVGCGGSEGSPDAAPTADAHPAPELGVPCVSKLCAKELEGCCHDPHVQPMFYCHAFGSKPSCPGDLRACDGPEDCDSHVCCTSDHGANTSCTCDPATPVVCHYDEDCPTSAPYCCNSECASNMCI